MFLSLLNLFQRNAYAVLAHRIVACFPQPLPDRRAILDMQLSELGTEIAAPPAEISDMPNLDLFDTSRSRAIALMELYVLAYAGRPTLGARVPILEDLEIAGDFAISEVIDMRQWARRHGLIALAGRRFIDEDRCPSVAAAVPASDETAAAVAELRWRVRPGGARPGLAWALRQDSRRTGGGRPARAGRSSSDGTSHEPRTRRLKPVVLPPPVDA